MSAQRPANPRRAAVFMAIALVCVVVGASFVRRRSLDPTPRGATIGTARQDAGVADASSDSAEPRRDPESDGPAAPFVRSGPCAVTFAEGSAPAMSDEALKAAAFPHFDARKNRVLVRPVGEPLSDGSSALGVLRFAPPEKDPSATGSVRVEPCAGEPLLLLDAPYDVRVIQSDPAESSELSKEALFALAKRRGLEGVVVARILVGEIGGLCDEPAGLLVLARLVGRRLEVLASTAWNGRACSKELGAISLFPWGEDAVLVEDVEDASGEQPGTSRHKVVRAIRDGGLPTIAWIQVEFEQRRADPEEKKPTKSLMRASLEPTDAGILVHETHTRVEATVIGDELVPKPGAKPVVVSKTRRYWTTADGGVAEDPP